MEIDANDLIPSSDYGLMSAIDRLHHKLNGIFQSPSSKTFKAFLDSGIGSATEALKSFLGMFGGAAPENGLQLGRL